MNSRDLVKNTLEFSSPPRVPRQLWYLPWARDHYPTELAEIQKRFPDDIVSAPGFYTKEIKTSGDAYSVGTYVDEWGCIFENTQKGVIGEVKEPLLKTLDDVENLQLPEELLSVDIAKVNEFCCNTDKFVLSGCCPRPFERSQFIRKSENLYIDLAEHPDKLIPLIQKLHQFFIKECEIWVKTDIDALSFMDDWGSQRSLLISPKLWRELFKPLYKDYIDIAHSHNKYCFMHSDGNTLAIIPDLIELGLDAINTQIFCMDIKNLGKYFRGKITFWGEIDRQYLLSFGSPQDIVNAVKSVRESLYYNGGVIAQCEFGAGSKPENVYQVYKTWEELD